MFLATRMKKSLHSTIVVIILFALNAIVHWNTIGLPLLRDEGEYAYAARQLNHGEVPYSDSFLQKPPMIIYTYWVAELFDDESSHVFRWFVVLFHSVSAFVLGVIARREIGRYAVWPARLMLGPLLIMPNLDQCTANTEQFLVLPLLVVWWLFAKFRSQASSKIWFLAGVATAATLLYKYTALPMLVVIFFFWIWDFFRQPNAGIRILKRVCAAIFGFVTCTVVVLLPFLMHDGGRDLYECTIRFNQAYASAHLFQLKTILMMFGRYYLPSWPLILLGIAFLVLHWKSRRWFFLGMIAAALVSTAGSKEGQYYLLPIPMLAFLAAGGIATTVRILRRSFRVPTKWTRIVMTVAGVIAAFFPNSDALTVPPKAVEQIKYAPYPFTEALLVSQKLKELSRPEDRILIAGSEPEVFYYSRRRSATRFTIVYPLIIPTKFAADYQKQAIDQIERNRPEFVIHVRNSTSWLFAKATPTQFPEFVERLVKQDYSVIASVVKSDSGGDWIEYPDASRLNSCIIVVYRRKHHHE